MGRSYPIWNDVTACIYGSSKSWGAKDTSEIAVKVGSSGSLSHTLGHVVTTRRKFAGDWEVFKLSVDMKVIKTVYFNTRSGEFRSRKPKVTASLASKA